MSVLVLASDEDAVADRVAAELTGRGVLVVRMNPSVFPQRLSMAARISCGEPWSGSLTPEVGESIDLAAIRSVWLRQSSQFVVDDRMSAPETAFAYGEARRGFGGVLAALGRCLWVNDPMAAARAEYKPVQLAAAVEVGLAIPSSLITSDPLSAHDWARELGRPIIYKPLAPCDLHQPYRGSGRTAGPKAQADCTALSGAGPEVLRGACHRHRGRGLLCAHRLWERLGPRRLAQ